MGKIKNLLGLKPERDRSINLSTKAELALERIAFALERLVAAQSNGFSPYSPDAPDLPPEAEFENFDEMEDIKNEQDELNRRRRDDRVRDLQRRG